MSDNHEAANDKKIYTVADIQKILNLSQNTAYSFIRNCYENKINFRVLKIGRDYRIPITSFEKWLYGEQ